jgi:hypothetical protein
MGSKELPFGLEGIPEGHYYPIDYGGVCFRGILCAQKTETKAKTGMGKLDCLKPLDIFQSPVETGQEIKQTL